MRSTLLLSLLLLASLSAAGDEATVVAVVNGEEVTAAKLDLLWEQAGEQARAQFERNGGKQAFLTNYIPMLLLLQDAVKEGYERPTGLPLAEQTAQEAALLDLYIRDVIAPGIVTEKDVRKFYDENPRDFLLPERARARHILISTQERTKEEARERLGQVMVALHPFRLKAGTDPSSMAAFVAAFDRAARDYSEDAAAAQGGDLGWVTRDMLEPEIGEVLFSLAPRSMSGMIGTNHGFHLIMLEDKEPPAAEPFEQASPAIREFLLTRSGTKIAEAVRAAAARLSRDGTVEIFIDNLE